MTGKKKGSGPNRQQQQAAAAARRGAGVRATRPGPTEVPGPPPLTATPVIGVQEAKPTGRYHYVDIGAVHIQQWLARTPDLKGWRGASAHLSMVTGQETWQPRLPAGMRWNDEAGDLDGVVSLRTSDKVDDGDNIEGLVSAAREVVVWLREQMPAVALQAVHGTGASYADAYTQIEQRRARGDVLIDAPAAPPQVVLAKPCDACRISPASIPAEQPDDEDLCADCAARYGAAGGTKGHWQVRSPAAEKRVRDALQADHGLSAVRFPDDFEALAQAGQVAADDAATQIALIYADGNRVGAFLHDAAEQSTLHGRPAKADIVTAIDSATLRALVGMVTGVYPGSGQPPVLAHVAGGDDVMVSVPARDAWPAVTRLLAGFDRYLAEYTSTWPPTLTKHLPSISAGVVFHHRSAPFPDMVRLVKSRLTDAKRFTSGGKSSVAFLDVTVDGAEPPTSRQPLTLTQLHTGADQWGRTAALAASQRMTLLTLLRRADAERIEPGDLGEPATETLARRVVDLGDTAQVLWDIIAGPEPTAARVADALRVDAAARARLRATLDLARHWPRSEEPVT